jgi:hypothetical protein
MTRDQLLAKAGEVFKAVETSRLREGAFVHEDTIDDNVKNRFPRNLMTVFLHSSLPQLAMPVTIPLSLLGPNIRLVFSGNKLFAIQIFGLNYDIKNDGSPPAQLITQVRNQYGEPRVFRGISSPTFYSWETPDKIIYAHGAYMSIIDKQMLR